MNGGGGASTRSNDASVVEREPTGDGSVRAYPRGRIAAVIFAGLVIMFARRPDGASGLYLWAEDGTVFISNAISRGSSGLLDSYVGQWWIATRLASQPIPLLPAQWWPLAAYVLAVLLGTLAIAVVLQQRAAALLGPLPLRVALFFALIAQPLVFEIQGNLANLHVWLAMALLVILALPDPRTQTGRIAEIAFIALSGLSGFVGFVVWPVAAWTYMRSRSPYRLLRLIVVTAAAATNALVSWGTRTPGESTAADYAITGSVMLVKRFAGGMLLGDAYQTPLWGEGLLSPWMLPALLFMLGVGLLIVWDRFGPSPAWFLSGLLWIALGTSAVIGGTWEELKHPFVVGRYLDLLVAATILIVFRALSMSRQAGRSVAAGLVVAMSFSFVTGLLIPQQPVGARVRLDRAQLEAFGQCMRTGSRPCSLPILPHGWILTIDDEPSSRD